VVRHGADARRHRGLDAAILGPPAIWAASATWRPSRPLGDCKKCKERWREDKIDGVCPNCGSTEFTEPRAFNLMFKTQAGPVEGEERRLPAARNGQGIFTNFANVLASTRKKPPFGIAQIGKSFRNEITPQNFVFRTREFEQMEMSTSCHRPTPRRGTDTGSRPATTGTWTSVSRPNFCDCTSTRRRISRNYSKGTTDVEFLYPWGWDELEGVANRAITT